MATTAETGAGAVRLPTPAPGPVARPGAVKPPAKPKPTAPRPVKTPTPPKRTTPPARPAYQTPGRPRPLAGDVRQIDLSRTGVQQILDYAMTLLGVDYKWGGKHPDQGGLDCSGLIAFVYGQYGINVNGPSRQQAQMGTAVAAKDAQPGDLLAFDVSSARPGIDHIGIYLGNGQMLVAPKTGDVVKVQKVNLASVKTIRRVIPDTFSRDGLTNVNGKLAYQPSEGIPVAPASKASLAAGVDSAQPEVADPGAPAGGALAAMGRAAVGLPQAGGTGIKPTTDLRSYSDQQLETFARDNYPDMAWALTIPDVKSAMFRWMREGQSDQWLLGQLYNTQWWKTTQKTARDWQQLKAMDPAAWDAKVAQSKAEITALSQRIGAPLTAAQINDLSDKQNRLGWTDAQIQEAVAGQFRYTSGKAATGQGGGQVANLKALADEYLVPLSDVTLSQWAQKMLTGQASEQTFTAYLTEQAKSLFPAITAALDSGISVRQYFEPYAQLAARTLEVAPESIDLNDPKWFKALGQVDDKGNRSVMSLTEWSDYVRRDPQYRKTKQATATAAETAELIGREMGVVR